MRRVSFFLAYIFLTIFPVLAQLEGNPENWCRNGFFPQESENYSIGVIKALKGQRVYFLDDDRKCPNDKDCQLKSYLINGDQILISRTFGEFVCAWYQPRNGAETVGWLPKNKIDFPSFPREKYESWNGDWRYYSNSLKIKRIDRTDEYRVIGDALWKGQGDNVHVGDIEAIGTLRDSVIKLKQDDCEVRLNLVLDYLVVADNMRCGGMNVSFTGVYRKKSGR